jgi:hypothetical protein
MTLLVRETYNIHFKLTSLLYQPFKLSVVVEVIDMKDDTTKYFVSQLITFLSYASVWRVLVRKNVVHESKYARNTPFLVEEFWGTAILDQRLMQLLLYRFLQTRDNIAASKTVDFGVSRQYRLMAMLLCS